MTDGYIQYLAWIEEAGASFSPMSPSKRLVRVGDSAAWTVEGLYQGSKLIAVEDLELVRADLPIEVFRTAPRCLIRLPGIMTVRDSIKQHLLFRLMKSGRGFDGKRNLHFGRTAAGTANWSWSALWRSPLSGAEVDEDTFLSTVYAPAYQNHLAQFPEALEKLRTLQRTGTGRITDAMCDAHSHLRILRKFLLEGDDPSAAD